MPLMRDKLWKIGRNLLLASFGCLILLVITAEILNAADSTWLLTIGNLICVPLLIGAIIVWAFAIRFYARVHQDLGVTRSAVYLAILICMNWVSPFIFIAVEGRDRFFGISTE